MVVFGLLVDKTDEIENFVYEMQEKLLMPDLFQNPFTGFIRLEHDEDTYLLCSFENIWPNPFYPAFFLTLTILIVNSFKYHWSLLIMIPLWMGAFMFSPLFLKWSTHISLRRAGYKGQIKRLKDNDLLLRLSNWDKQK